MKTKLLFAITLFFSLSLYSQESCGTTTPLNYQQFENVPSKQQASNDIFCINISFHIVRETNGSGGFPTSNIDNIIQILNEDYNQYGIFFNEVGVDFISDDDFYDLVYTDEDRSMLDALFSQNNDANAIDFYLVGSLTLIDDGVTRILAGVASSVLSSDLIVRNSSALSNTSTHEIGHALNLLHTHEIFYGIENITRDPNNVNYNCEDEGDKLCDTEADPNLEDKVNFSCNYNGGEFRNGIPYDPDTHNYMSYTRRSCRDEFTPGQVDVMKAALIESSILQPVVSNSCAIPEINGSDLVCSSSSTFTLQNAPASVNWNIGSNLTIISQTSSSITVQASNNNVRGASFVEINGGAARKDFYVGKPYAYFPQVPVLCTNSFSDPYTLPESEGAISYRVKSSSPFLQINGQSEVTFTNGPISQIFFSSNNSGTYLVELFTENGCGESRAAMYVTSESCGIGGPGEFTIYPNPATNEVNIAPNYGDGTKLVSESQNLTLKQYPKIAKLFDFNGVYIKDVELNVSGTTKMEVSNLREGLYFLKIPVGETEETHKIMVVK